MKKDEKMEAFWFWIMKPVAELAIGLAALIVAAAGYGLICLPGWWKQRKCPHSRVRETGACDAICQSCGKNLGFIGAWRDKQKDKPSNDLGNRRDAGPIGGASGSPTS